jgi:micrococcal nuclease
MYIQHKIIVAPHKIPADAIRLEVLHVGDGDGFRTKLVHRPGIELRADVRFAFIDAPELNQRGGPEARDFLRSLIDRKVLDVAVTNKTGTGNCVDQYGRIVGVPFLAEASTLAVGVASNTTRKLFGTRQTLVRNIELEMVLHGWAWVLERYGPEGAYREAQEYARRRKRGIWAYDSNLAPWAFKKQVRDGRLPEDRFLANYGKPVANSIGSACPSHGCRGTMQLRKGKQGKFLGCSSFPRCKITRNQ